MTWIVDRCPECEMQWAHGDQGQYSKLIAIYDHYKDRTVAWRCPGCSALWDRGDPVLSRDGD
jgi:uncharacterized protein with PIN domain